MHLARVPAQRYILPLDSRQVQVLILPGWAGARKYYPKDCDSKLAVVWLILVQPLLFGAIGVEIDFRQIQGSLIWKTVIILALGWFDSMSHHLTLHTPLLVPCTTSRARHAAD